MYSVYLLSLLSATVQFPDQFCGSAKIVLQIKETGLWVCKCLCIEINQYLCM